MKNLLFIFLSILCFGLTSQVASAGQWESSIGFNYTKSQYPNDSYSFERRYGFSFGYGFSDSSTVEFSYQKSFTRNHITGFEDSTFEDTVLSVNWLQYIFGKQYVFQPYFKIGVGQLNRDASSTNGSGQVQEFKQDSVTGVIGVGFRYYLTKTFAIRTELTSYLSGGHLGSYKDNIAASFGISMVF